MKSVSVLVFAAVLAVVYGQNKYTNKYDNVDVDMILKNERVLTNYIKCMMEEGPCTAEGRELKKTLPDALASGCTKCNIKQKDTAEKVMKHLMSRRPKDWDRLTKKYDPQGNFKKRYEEHLQKEKKAA
ncbi:ejaculatory bulb-specific protein 3-like [Diabrotica virgifera virgifera]|uniref:Ejaculatory bulb-specific protein 3-like n=1 Tax=Diabrotica virgifera virgifera TaxID=50390 RepID=A0A6P7GKA2_DIAVI|nr:ejaculatory bulb-specific protein 3-like [Diabrotica virgifera virgifera]